MGIRIDFTTKNLIGNQNSVKRHTFMDIGTSNLNIIHDNGRTIINDINTTNFDKEAIKNSLNNILNFRTGDSPLLPEFGIGQLYELLYSTIDKYSTEKINLTIKSILNTWEPRIVVTSAPIEHHDDNSIEITINYYIPALNNAIDSFVYSVQR